MIYHALRLQGVYSSILNVKYSQLNAKKQYLCVRWQKIAQQAWKIDVSVPSARFSNYAQTTKLLVR